jgi:carbonic anhydrase
MSPQTPTRRLLRTLGLGWLGFLGVGMALRYAVSVTEVVVVIDHSYCPAAQWQQQVVQPYTDLYAQSQQNQLQITQVIYVTNLDQVTLPSPPTPEALGNPFGNAPAPEDMAALQEQFPEAVFLGCSSP